MNEAEWSRKVRHYMGDPMGDEFEAFMDQKDLDLLAAVWEDGHSSGRHNEHEFREGKQITNPYKEHP